MLFMHRNLGSRLDLLKPIVASEGEKAQEVQFALDRHMLKSDRSRWVTKCWLVIMGKEIGGHLGVVSAVTGPLSYTVYIGSSEHWRRHADQMLARHAELDAPHEGGHEVSRMKVCLGWRISHRNLLLNHLLIQ